MVLPKPFLSDAQHLRNKVNPPGKLWPGPTFSLDHSRGSDLLGFICHQKSEVLPKRRSVIEG